MYRKKSGLGLAIVGTALLLGGAVSLYIHAASEEHRNYSGVQMGRFDHDNIGRALIAAGLLLLIPALIMLRRRR